MRANSKNQLTGRLGENIYFGKVKNNKSAMKKILLFVFILLSFCSCLNYIPCRGQDYIVEGITHQELINKFNELRENYPEYNSMAKDYKNEYLPYYYISLKWEDLNISISCDIHIGDQIANPPTHLKFTAICDSVGFKDINSKEIDQASNEIYKQKFEKEILNKMDIKWKREGCW